MDLKAAIIGCGRTGQGATGTGISHHHARGYRDCPHTTLVALCDIDIESARAFQALHGGDQIFTDYREMLAAVKPDIVSICTWPGLHEEMVLTCVQAGVPAIHCEKPLAPTWAAAQRMVNAAQAAGLQLTFNHQRRFDPAYMRAKELIDSGEIGELQRIEMPTVNLFDWATHWFDIIHFYNNQQPAQWVMGQVEPTGGSRVFGVQLEGQGLAQIGFANGVLALVPTGGDQNWRCQNRIFGSEGVIEIGATGWDSFRYRATGMTDWVMEDVRRPEGVMDAFGLGITDLCEALRDHREPALSARNALMATELIFATYESARRGRRNNLPLDAPDVAIYAQTD